MSDEELVADAQAQAEQSEGAAGFAEESEEPTRPMQMSDLFDDEE